MAGKREPIDLVIAKGKKHLTKAETDARRDSEVKLLGGTRPKNVKPPSWLPEALKKAFRGFAKPLTAAGIFTELDADTLGRYLIAQQEYLAATQQAQAALVGKDVDGAKDWSQIQERYFKQARGCASDLGLTISSRCRLVLPQGLPQAAGDGGEDEFSRKLRQRQATAMGEVGK